MAKRRKEPLPDYIGVRVETVITPKPCEHCGRSFENGSWAIPCPIDDCPSNDGLPCAGNGTVIRPFQWWLSADEETVHYVVGYNVEMLPVVEGFADDESKVPDFEGYKCVEKPYRSWVFGKLMTTDDLSTWSRKNCGGAPWYLWEKLGVR